MLNHNIFIALPHFPAMDREGRTIITFFTTMDLHDIARPVRAYELVDAQRAVIKKQIKYWSSEEGLKTNPTRAETVSLVRLAYNLEEVIEDIQNIRGRKPKLVGTDARTYPNTVSYKFLKRKIEKTGRLFNPFRPRLWHSPRPYEDL